MQRCLVLEVLGEICPRAGRLLGCLLLRRQMVRVELRTYNFNALDDLLHVVLVLIFEPILWRICSRLIVSVLITTVLRHLFLLFLRFRLVHFTLQLLHPELEALLALLVDAHLQQLFVLLRHPHLSALLLVRQEGRQIIPKAIVVPEDFHALRV